METSPKEYPHFTRSYTAELILLIFFCPVFIAFWSFAAYYYYYSGAISAPLMKSAIYYTGAFAFALIFYGNARAVMSSRAVVMDGERVVKKGASGASAVHYADVACVRRSRLPFANRWMVLETKSGGAFALPLCIRGGHEMAERVFSELSKRGIFFEGDGLLLRRFRYLALRAGALQELRGQSMQNFTRVAAAAALFNGTVASLYWERGLIVTLSWGFVGMLFQALAYLVAERVYTVKMFGWGVGNRVDRVDRVDTINTVDTVNTADTVNSFSSLFAVSALIALFAAMITGILITVPE